MLLQIILAVFGLSATVSTSWGLCHPEEEHWENVMAMEQDAVQIQTRLMEKASELGLINKEECAARIREIKERGREKYDLNVLAMKFGHWLREKITSYQTQHAEIAEAFKITKLMVKILQDTLDHIEEEKKLNQSEAEKTEANEYELVDEELVKLEAEKQEWELLLKNLRNKLENLAQHRR